MTGIMMQKVRRRIVHPLLRTHILHDIDGALQMTPVQGRHDFCDKLQMCCVDVVV